MTFAGQDISTMYRDACKTLLDNGQKVIARGLTTLEVTSVQFQLYKPRNRFVNYKARHMDMRYCVGELCYFLDGRRDLASIAHYSKFWEKVSDDGKSVNSAYGYRMFRGQGQDLCAVNPPFDYVLGTLIKDPSTRKAVIPIYNVEDGHESNDNPCTMFLQFLIRNRRLDCYVFMRSEDFWLGVPYDVAFFTLVHESMFVALQQNYPDLRLGFYYHNVTSFHAYQRDWKAMTELYHEGDHRMVQAPALTQTDVSDWFDDLLTYEKAKRGKVLYKGESRRTAFQDWCKNFLDD